MSTADAAAEQYANLRRLILEQQLKPGTVLLETALAARFGVSRTPVREALARLAQEGLITKQKRGYVVDELSPEEIIEVFDVRILLECAAVEKAATDCDDFRLAHLEQLTEQLDELIATLRTAIDTGDAATQAATGEAILAANVRWHEALRAGSRNRTLIRMINQLMDVQKIYNPLMKVHDLAEISKGQQQHHELVAALRDRDPARAREIMADHLTRVRQIRVAEFARSLHSAEQRGSSS
ncbi:GntR family transcriptional regulator [Saccharopolyspora shandongensis]|uniref:GntR family transcriptional regulator n=1 Tax=Saccharopolyspora shandongensis TaxID=418495 RepID=UPI00342F7E11